MRFTNSPFEKMMQQVPRTLRPTPPKPRRGSPCAGCSYGSFTRFIIATCS